VTVLAAAGGADAPGTLSFLVIFGMAVILFFLFRSMSKHLRKVTGRPPRGRGGAAAAATEDGGPAPSAGPGAPGTSVPGQAADGLPPGPRG
jgi:hypothetical protein